MKTALKVAYGINTVVVGTLYLTTVKLKVSNNFPFAKLPTEVVVYPAKGNYKIITYSAIRTEYSVMIVEKIGQLLKEHALNKLNAKYGWCAPMEERYALADDWHPRCNPDNADLPW